MIGERLKRARAAAGLSMHALGMASGISANMVKKYEHDISIPGSAILLRLAKAVGVRSEYFFRPYSVQLGDVEYRKRATASKTLLKRIEADVVDQAERWYELANLWPNFPLPPFELPSRESRSITSLDQVELLAEEVRDNWGLGRGAVSDLIDVLERNGILVIVTHVDTHLRFDGLQAFIQGKPVIVICAHWPGDRQRFTLAHELGHLLMGGRLAKTFDEERACNRFASAFLLPAGAARQHLGYKRYSLEMRELYLLKQEYGLSMQACLYRAADLNIIDLALRNRMFISFAKRGWRKTEPGTPAPQEHTLLFQQLVYRALGEGIVGESKAAELLGISHSRFRQARKLELTDVADQ